jgi:serine/threonine-protein kinase HipA
MAALCVWMNGEYVGVWSTSRNAVPVFKYDGQWATSASARALSLSLPLFLGPSLAHSLANSAGPLEHRGAAVANYFDNLLPDNADIRKRLATRFKTPSTNAFDLLTAIGRDCVGAVQLLPEGQPPQGWNHLESEAVNSAQVERLLRAATSDAPLGQTQDDGFDNSLRISLAGAQEKTALLRIGRKWHRPIGATPTTHILKMPMGLVGRMRADMSASVENEWLCAQILRELGLPVAHTEMASFGQQKVLVVERFDRRWQNTNEAKPNSTRFKPSADAWIARLPQEDFCQATGTAPTQKYESDGGPSMLQCLQVLAGSANADNDRRHFVLAQFAFWILAATDGHAKNFSIFHHRGGGFSMTPLYDVISAWPVMGKGPNQVSEHSAKLAMALQAKNKHDKLIDVRARHWQNLALRCGVDGVWEEMVALAEGVEAALGRVKALLPDEFPTRVWLAVRRGAVGHAMQFLREAHELKSNQR